jgi:putative transposase
VIKARHAILRLSASDQLRLKEIQQEAARCWNDILGIAKGHYDAGNGWISKGDLQKTLKGNYRLHSQTIQALLLR